MKRLPGIGATIRRLRLERGMTQEELADVLGVTQPTVSYYEQQDGLPNSAQLPALARALGVTVDELLSDDGRLVAS